MAITVKLKHVDDLKDGTFRFRRRYPKKLWDILGEEPMQERMKARDEVGLVREQAAWLAEFDRRVADAEKKLLGLSGESPRQKWARYLDEADRMVADISGPVEIGDKRTLLAAELARVEADPLLYRAVASPASTPPEVTLLDAKNEYLATVFIRRSEPTSFAEI